MQYRFLSISQLAGLLNITEEQFHREVKNLIKSDFKDELQRMTIKNPDILLDESNIIILASPRDHNNHFVTGVSIFSYID